MKDLMRPALALFLVAPLTLIAQTTTNADPSQIPKTYKELVNEIDNYYNEQFPDQVLAAEIYSNPQHPYTVELLDEYNLNNELRDMSDAGEQDIEEELYVLPDEQANSLEDMGAGQESINEWQDEYNLDNELRDISDADDQDLDEELYVLPEFVVSNDQDEGYYSANSTSVTRTNTLVKNSPISMSIVNEQLLDDLNILNTQDLAMVSAAIDEDPNGFSLDRIRIRGFRNSFSRFNFFKRNLPSDNYNIGRVDIIKGANSLIFGQASPGGSTNSAPLLANFKGNDRVANVTVGNKEFFRTRFSSNQIINDQFAVRLMAVHNEIGADNPLTSNNLDAFTFAATWRVSPKTQVRMHLEGVDVLNKIPVMSMRDVTRFDDGHPQNGHIARGNAGRNPGTRNDDGDLVFDREYDPGKYEGILSSADYNTSITDYSVPFSPDWVDFLPQNAMDWIINNDNNGINSRDDLRAHYSAIDSETYGTVGGPDKYNQRDGIFLMGDLDHQINDNVIFNLSVNHERILSESLGRENASKVYDSLVNIYPYLGKTPGKWPKSEEYKTYGVRPREEFAVNKQFIKTYWIKSNLETERYNSRSSLVFENDWFNATNKFIIGWDFNYQRREESYHDQVPDDAFDQQYGNPSAPLLPGAYIPIGRAQSETVSSDNRAYEYIDISDLSNRSILRFNNIIESDIGNEDFVDTTKSWDDVNGVKDTSKHYSGTAMWALNRTTKSKVMGNSLWFAGQSEFFDGRLHSLIGLRYDHIKIDSAFRKVLFYGYDLGNNDEKNNESEIVYDQFNPTIGTLFWVTNNIGFFANYAQSIESPSGTDRTPTGEIAPPELGEGFEAGIRFDLLEGKLDGQIAVYRIIKENDSEFTYSDGLLKKIYTFEQYGAQYPEIFNPKNNSLVTSLLPGRRGIGDKTRSEGMEMDLTYNPMPGLSIIASYHYQIANEIEELHPFVKNPGNYYLFGRPDHRFSITGRYKFRDGSLKGLTLGASQRFRSATPQTRFDLHYDAANNPVGKDDAVRTESAYLEFEDEHTTTIFATWSKKLGSKRSSPKLDLAFRMNNVFDNDEFTGRLNYGFYRASRSYNFSGTIHF
jgi:outer membrane receptor protein involved in Fe transport